MRNPLKDGRFLYGGDYNPEQWPEAIWHEDMALMKEAGVNFVSIAIFGWAKLQSARDVFHFEWLDRLMDLLHEHEIQANLATATASPPAWLIRLHPEILPTRADGSRLGLGSRQHCNPASPAFREAVATLTTAIAQRYKDHPALACWHVNNEYACHTPADYGEETAEAFREWLLKRYQTIEALNDAWGTAFWSQHYYEWEEITPPRDAPTFPNPGQALDFQRFSSEMILECFLVEARILRAITPNIPINTNFMDWFKAVDYTKWAEHMDFTSLDSYPEPNEGCTSMALSADQTRSYNENEPWMVMEQVTTHVNWRQRNPSKRPGMMRLLSYQSIARGSNGICFFQWRQAKAGAEKFHGSMVGHGDPAEQRCFQEVKALGKELSRIGEITESRVCSKVALYFDHENWWALETPSKPNHDLNYRRGVDQFHGALHRANIPMDFVFERSDLSQYKLLIVPCLYLTTEAASRKFESFVKAGGQLIVTYFSGIVDAADHVHLGGYPGPLRELLGITVDEWRVPADDTPFEIKLSNDAGLKASYEGTFWTETVFPKTAEVIGRFADGESAGYPAITRNTYGKGSAWYLATDFEPDFYLNLVEMIGNSVGINAPIDSPEGVEVRERHTDSCRYLFCLNHTNQFKTLQLGAIRGHELITDTAINSDSLMIPADDVRIIRLKAEQ